MGGERLGTRLSVSWVVCGRYVVVQQSASFLVPLSYGGFCKRIRLSVVSDRSRKGRRDSGIYFLSLISDYPEERNELLLA